MQDDPVLHRLKLRELRVLLAVTEAGSMAKAATQLAISQPAVSRAIADMEASLGVSLFDRGPQGVKPTPYGRALINRSVAVFDELRQGVTEIKFIADPTAGEVRIAGSSTMVVGLIAAVIDRLSRRYPRISFHVVTTEPAMLDRELRERKVDFIITVAPVNEEEMDVETLYDDQMVVVAAAKNPWTRRRRFELAELANEPWALPAPDSGWGTAVARAFRANGMEPPRATVTSSSSPLRNVLLATGRFLTVVHESHLHFPERHPSLKVLPVDLSTTRRPTRIITLKGRTLSPAARLFIECAREVAKPLAKRK
ncbi:MAG: LysR family transcriptional regulator [Xanthobacteraceae bacterium]